MKVNMLSRLLLLTVVLSLSACVTVKESRLTKKASPEKAVENYTELGLGYLERDRPELARKRLEKALAIDNKYAPANDAMGLLWQVEGEYDLAEEFFKKALSQDAKYTRARHHLGALYSQLKQYPKAEKELKRASADRYYAGRAQAYADLAMLYYHQDNSELAINTYKETLRLSPYNAQALVNVSTLYFEEQNYPESQRYFNRLERLVQREQTQHSAHSLWLGIKLATIAQNTERAIALASDLKRYYPDSQEFKQYQESLSGVR